MIARRAGEQSVDLVATATAMAFRLLAGLCVAVTLLPLSTHRAWWVRSWDFPRQQIVALGLLAGAGLLATLGMPTGWDRWLLVALGAALAYQIALVLPYTKLWPVQGLAAEGEAGERIIRLVTVNVLMTNREVDGLGTTLEEADPDVVLALEPDAWWAERLGELLPGHTFRVLHPLDNTYGIALFSRLELLHAEVRFLLKEGVPSIRARVRLPSGEDVVLLGIHPEPPSPTESDSSLPRDAELVLVGREIAKDPKPVIVAGDLNDVAWSRTSRLFRRLSRTIDPRVGRGFYNSFHATYRWMRWPLDHVFYTSDFLLRDLRRLPAFGSDHFPILIELEYHPRAAEAQELDEPGHADHREAKETVAEALEAEAS
jgi:endonuclease/exonuclease/phosphatase (EEP) superfamily protein YafD